RSGTRSEERLYLRMRFLVVAAVVTLAGCPRPTYTYEPRPALATPATPAEACVQREQLAVAAAHVRWERHRPGYAPDTYVSTSYRDNGLVLYRGHQRLDARAALRRIGDEGLSRDYESLLSQTEHDYRLYPVYRNTTVGLATAGTVLIVVGSAWLL